MRARRHFWPLFTVLVGLVGTLFIWARIVRHDEETLSDAVQMQVGNISTQVESVITDQVKALERLAARWAVQPPTPEQWRADALNYVTDFQAYQAIEWADPDCKVQWIMPLEGNEAAQGLNLCAEPRRRNALERARSEGTPHFTESIDLVQGGKGFLVLVPIGGQDNFGGYILGVYRFTRLFADILNSSNAQLALRVVEGTTVVFATEERGIDRVGVAAGASICSPYGVQWKLHARPTKAFVAAKTSVPPYSVALVGVLFTVLSTAVVVLHDRARRREGELGEANKKLCETMQELEYHIAQANSLAEAALEANVAKSEFLANMSHEIRTPMTAILGFAETLADNVRHPEDVASVSTIKRNGEYLLALINDILDLSKVEAGKMTVEIIPVDPCRLLAEVWALMRKRATGSGLTFDLEFDGAIPETIETDPTRLRQILLNLIANAIKFTEVGGVRVVTSHSNNRGNPIMQFDVVDTGIGMTKAQIAGLFRPFSQADNTTTRRFGGSGLGLAISKRFSEMLGGNVKVVETSPGKGTRFRLTIKTGPLDNTPLRSNPTAHMEPAQDEAAQPHKAPTLEGIRVLLAEDGPDNQRLIVHLLKKAGAEVEVRENGRSAMRAALEARDAGSPFDVVLMDVQMPEMDGHEASRRLRSQGYNLPIISLTAHAMDGDRQKCIDAGCDDYATKPIDLPCLVSTIVRHVRKRQASEAVNT